MKLGWLLMLLFAPDIAHAASFDCKKVLSAAASATDERTVCLDERLSSLDDLLGKAYSNVRAKIGDDAVWRAKQFLVIRRDCQAVRSCIANAYLEALQTYQSLGSGVEFPSWVYPYAREVGAAPLQVGTCSRTSIEEIAGRLEGDTEFSSGTSVNFENGTGQVSYDREEAIIDSRPGDKVLQCLISVPRNCPPGDLRGRLFTVTNFRTQQSWTLSDSQHSCGGA